MPCCLTLFGTDKIISSTWDFSTGDCWEKLDYFDSQQSQKLFLQPKKLKKYKKLSNCFFARKAFASYELTVVTKSESGDWKLKFDWLNFINRDPKVIFRYDWPIKPQNLCPTLGGIA